MLAKFLCYLLGHKRRTIHNLYGVSMGKRIVENHKTCPRCGESLNHE